MVYATEEENEEEKEEGRQTDMHGGIPRHPLFEFLFVNGFSFDAASPITIIIIIFFFFGFGFRGAGQEKRLRSWSSMMERRRAG